MSRRVLLYVVGVPPETIASTMGDYTVWFSAIAGDVDLVPMEGRDISCPAPNPRDYDGVIITGSAETMTERAPWKERCCEVVRHCHDGGIPVLGVCFGHQVIGAAFGAPVVRNPHGWEASTMEVTLNDLGTEDPLFKDTPVRFNANLLHEDVIDPNADLARRGIAVLASTPRAPVQAVAVGDHVRGVQFHPEFSGAGMRAFIGVRSERLAEDARRRNTPSDDPAALTARADDAPMAVDVFSNFLTQFVAYA